MAQAAVLSKEETQRIFSEDILPDILATRHAKGPEPASPTAMLLGGQPASGKTPQLNEAARQLSRNGATLVISADDLYSYHPHHDSLIAKHGSPAAMEMMKDQAGQWTKLLLAEAQKRKFNVVMETTMRQPDVVAKQAAEFRQNGYKVHARVLAVPAEESWVSNRFRYEQMHVLGKAARLTPRSVHDEAVGQLLNTVNALEKGRAVDSIDVVRRDPRDFSLYHNELKAGEWQRAPGAVQSIEAERARPWSDARMANYQSAWKAVEKLAEQRLTEQRVPNSARDLQLGVIAAERNEGTYSARQRNAENRAPLARYSEPRQNERGSVNEPTR
ncbi:zeta toxin family protein [Xanthomonas euvesicatoria pv. allii]|uniref:zeta toxin family protein n=1 Tax=Xanthomonas euvesicatoria TaxID=456327 RepID=UPI002406F9A5|nr:zeta toxin family protein [Xanthomonas euvesicatoria]MCP3050709.1 zeta toxin family protein [Xanthomonas euvesicatoria pv. allii]